MVAGLASGSTRAVPVRIHGELLPPTPTFAQAPAPAPPTQAWPPRRRPARQPHQGRKDRARQAQGVGSQLHPLLDRHHPLNRECHSPHHGLPSGTEHHVTHAAGRPGSQAPEKLPMAPVLHISADVRLQPRLRLRPDAVWLQMKHLELPQCTSISACSQRSHQPLQPPKNPSHRRPHLRAGVEEAMPSTPRGRAPLPHVIKGPLTHPLDNCWALQGPRLRKDENPLHRLETVKESGHSRRSACQVGTRQAQTPPQPTASQGPPGAPEGAHASQPPHQTMGHSQEPQ